MTYRDMTFCGAYRDTMAGSDCGNKKCYRYFDEIEHKRANQWLENPPIAFADMSGDCDYYEPKEVKE